MDINPISAASTRIQRTGRLDGLYSSYRRLLFNRDTETMLRHLTPQLSDPDGLIKEFTAENRDAGIAWAQRFFSDVVKGVRPKESTVTCKDMQDTIYSPTLFDCFLRKTGFESQLSQVIRDIAPLSRPKRFCIYLCLCKLRMGKKKLRYKLIQLMQPIIDVLENAASNGAQLVVNLNQPQISLEKPCLSTESRVHNPPVTVSQISSSTHLSLASTRAYGDNMRVDVERHIKDLYHRSGPETVYRVAGQLAMTPPSTLAHITSGTKDPRRRPAQTTTKVNDTSGPCFASELPHSNKVLALPTLQSSHNIVPTCTASPSQGGAGLSSVTSCPITNTEGVIRHEKEQLHAEKVRHGNVELSEKASKEVEAPNRSSPSGCHQDNVETVEEELCFPFRAPTVQNDTTSDGHASTLVPAVWSLVTSPVGQLGYPQLPSTLTRVADSRSTSNSKLQIHNWSNSDQVHYQTPKPALPYSSLVSFISKSSAHEESLSTVLPTKVKKRTRDDKQALDSDADSMPRVSNSDLNRVREDHFSSSSVIPPFSSDSVPNSLLVSYRSSKLHSPSYRLLETNFTHNFPINIHGRLQADISGGGKKRKLNNCAAFSLCQQSLTSTSSLLDSRSLVPSPHFSPPSPPLRNKSALVFVTGSENLPRWLRRKYSVTDSHP